MKSEVVTLTVSKYGVTVAISYFLVFAVVPRLGTPGRAAASLPPGLTLARARL